MEIYGDITGLPLHGETGEIKWLWCTHNGLEQACYRSLYSDFLRSKGLRVFNVHFRCHWNLSEQIQWTYEISFWSRISVNGAWSSFAFLFFFKDNILGASASSIRCWRYPKMDGLKWNILWRWMIWGYTHFRKAPCPVLLDILPSG